MLSFIPVEDLRGINTHVDATDQRAGQFRSLDNLVAWPAGALSAMVWTGATGELGRTSASDIVRADCKATIEAALSGEDQSKAHLVRVELTANTEYDLLCVWSSQLAKPLMLFPVKHNWLGAQIAPSTFQCPGPVNGGAPNGVTLLTADLDPSLRWYASPIADRIYLGNGTDANLRYLITSRICELLLPDADPAVADRAKEAFPPCTSFIMGVNREIYAAGNVTDPMRVWESDKPGVEYPLFEGIQSSDTSYTDITLDGASKITALSCWNNYISAHTDDGVVDLFGHNSVANSDGFKTEQRPSAVSSGAPNPDCVQDAEGQGAYFLASDNQLYYDQSIRGGPFNKHGDSRSESPLAQFGDWGQHMAGYADGDMRTIIQDRDRGLIYMFADLDAAGWGAAMWCYNEQNKSVTGPITGVAPAVVTSVRLGPKRVTTLLAMSADGILNVSCGPQEAFRQRTIEASAFEWDADTSEIIDGSTRTIARKDSEPLGLGLRTVEAHETAERVVFGDLTQVGTEVSALRTAGTWSLLETAMIDLGDANAEKTLREVRLSMDEGVDCNVIVVAFNDEGHYRVKETYPGNARTQPVLRFNLRGRRFRIAIMVARSIYQPLTLRGFTIGILRKSGAAKG